MTKFSSHAGTRTQTRDSHRQPSAAQPSAQRRTALQKTHFEANERFEKKIVPWKKKNRDSFDRFLRLERKKKLEKSGSG